MPVKYFAFDTETTGLEPFTQGDEIISIAFMLLDQNLFCVKKGQWFVQPDKPVSEEAAAINGYKPEIWAEKNAMSQAELADKLALLWEQHDLDRVFPLGQNVGFDVDFLKALAMQFPVLKAAMAKALSYHKIDTIPLAVALDQAHPQNGYPQYRLVDQAERWGVSADNMHDSFADLVATVALYTRYIEHLKQGPVPPKHLPSRFLEKYGETHRMRNGKHKGKLIDHVDAGYVSWMLRQELRDDERALLQAKFPNL